MTPRICFFGNSHAAAVRDAQTRYADRWEGAAITCIAAHRDRLLDTAIINGVLSPDTDEAADSFRTLAGIDNVDLHGFDALVILGCEFAASRAAYLYKQARWHGLPSLEKWSDPATAHWAFVSQPAFGAMLREMLQATLAVRFARHLQRGCDTPVWIAAQPRTATGVLTRPDHALHVLKHMIGVGDAQAVSEVFERNAAQLCAEHGIGYLPQPPQTIRDHVLTAPTFTRGAIRLTASDRSPQPPEDVLHANAAYGAAVIAQALDRIAPRPAEA